MSPGRYGLQGGRVASGQGALSAWTEFHVSARETTVIELDWVNAVGIRITAPTVGSGEVRLQSSTSPGVWMDASSPHDAEARLVVQEAGRLWGGRELRLFVLPGIWSGVITMAGNERSFLVDTRDGQDKAIAPWD